MRMILYGGLQGLLIFLGLGLTLSTNPALDARLNRMRARMLEDLALASPAADWTDAPIAQQPTCRDCGALLQLRSTQTRSLQTHGGQDLTFERRYGTCPACGAGLFPPR